MLAEIEIRYDGNDADNHVIEANELADSLKGFSRILGTAGHFLATGNYVKKQPAQEVRVLVAEAEPKCFNLSYQVWEFVRQQQFFQGFSGAALTALVAYIIARAASKQSEMKHLAEALKQAMSGTAATNERLLDTINKMADALRPSVRQAVAPIGGSAGTITIGGSHIVDAEDKDRIMSLSPTEVTSEREWVGVITELDRENATCKIRLRDDEDTRIPASITDPMFRATGNPYMEAFNTGEMITLIGKAELTEGDIKRLYISDTRPTQR